MSVTQVVARPLVVNFYSAAIRHFSSSLVPSILGSNRLSLLLLPMGNLVVLAWGCCSVWNGRHRTGTSEPNWREAIIVARGEIMSQVSVS